MSTPLSAATRATPATPASTVPAIVRVRRLLALLGLAVALAFYAELLAHAPATGQDFRNFYAAATVLRHGGNPYDVVQLVRAEDRLYGPTTAAQRRDFAHNPYVQGPLLAIAFTPFVGLPPVVVYKVYALLLAGALVAALILLARLWPPGEGGGSAARRVVLLAASPIAFAGLLLGQPDAVLALLLILSLWSTERGRWTLAGFLLLAVGLIKPQIIAGPAILLALPAWRRGGLARYAVGLCYGAVAFVGAGLLAAGPAVMTAWLRGLAGFGAATVYTQVDVSSLSTFYIGWAPHGLSIALALLGLAGWIAMLAISWQGEGALRTRDSRRPMTWPIPMLTGIWRGHNRTRGWRGYVHILGARARDGRGAALVAEGQARNIEVGLSIWERGWLALGLTGWLLVTPYAHPHDDVMLLPAAWYLLDRTPWRRQNNQDYKVMLLLAVGLAVAWWLCPLTSLLGLRPPLLRGLGVVPILLLLALLALLARTRIGSAAPRASKA